jgi:hypothetical protein
LPYISIVIEEESNQGKLPKKNIEFYFVRDDSKRCTTKQEVSNPIKMGMH